LTDTAAPQLYTLSLHDALPIYRQEYVQRFRILAAQAAQTFGAGIQNQCGQFGALTVGPRRGGNPLMETRSQRCLRLGHADAGTRSEEHTSELQSLRHLVCRLLL